MTSRTVTEGFVDMLFLMLCLIVLMVNPPKEAESSKPIADYTIYSVWNRGVDIDIDIHSLLPNGKVVWFSSSDQGFAALERDDLGTGGGHGEVNMEVLSYREPPDGRYYVSIRNFHASEAIENGTVSIEIENRDGDILFSRTLEMPHEAEEVGAVKFRIEDGEMVDIETTSQLIISRGEAFDD